MQVHSKRILKIASNILADIHFNNKEEFDEYLKEHPNYREDTEFYVNDVQVKPSSKRKKEHPKEEVSERQKYVDDWTNTIQSSTPIVLVNPFDDEDWHINTEFNEVYVLSYGNDKKTVFKPTNTNGRDQYIRKSIDLRQTPSSKREVISFKLSEKLGLGVIPPTYLTNRNTPHVSQHLNGKSREGSEQAFVNGETWMQMSIKKGQGGVRQLLKDEKIQKGLGMISITDYLLGSADRHNKNLMIDNNNNLYAIDNGLTFASNNYQDKYGDGEFRSLPTDILFRMYQDYDSDYSISNMQFEEYNVTEFDTDFNQLMKLEVIKDAGGYHPEVEKFFREMDYDKAEQTIIEAMQHYGMDKKSTKDTISRLRDIQGLFNY